VLLPDVAELVRVERQMSRPGRFEGKDVVEEGFDGRVGHREDSPSQGVLLRGAPERLAVLPDQAVDVAVKAHQQRRVL
jgi:hypothetical protein